MTTDKSSISFATPPKFSFTPTPSASGEQGTTEDNDDGKIANQKITMRLKTLFS